MTTYPLRAMPWAVSYLAFQAVTVYGYRYLLKLGYFD